MQEKKEQWWYHAGQRPLDSIIREAVQLYNEGWTLKELGEKFHRTKSNISVWINKFAKDLDNPDMRKKRICNVKGKAKRVTGIIAPETSPQPSSPSKEETPQQKIQRLEKELADARLARDFYNEMINVAEKQFSISIRKKAGARQ